MKHPRNVYGTSESGWAFNLHSSMIEMKLFLQTYNRIKFHVYRVGFDSVMVPRNLRPWMKGDMRLAHARCQFFRDWNSLRHRTGIPSL